MVAATGEGISRGLPVQAGAKSGGAWLRGLVPLTVQAATARACLGVELKAPDLAPTQTAFAAGDMSVGHAGVISRTMSALDKVSEVDGHTWAEAQHLLVAEATRIDPAQLGRAGQRLQHRLHPQGAEQLARDEDSQHATRECSLTQEASGMWLLHGLLPPLDGAYLQAAMSPLAAPQPASDGTPDPRSARQRRADALTALAQLSLSARGGDPAALPTRHGSPCRLVVTADLDTLTADLTTPGTQAGVPPASVETDQPGGADLSPLTAQMLSCDAEIVPVLLDSFGRPLDVGETQYRFPPRIRRAIEIRDLHCTFRDCQAPPAWCHTHHLIPYGRNGKPGGRTSEDNGTLLCGRHHRFVHAHGWTGQLINGQVHWKPPRPDDGTDPEPICTAHTRRFEQALKQLARRWLARNPQLRDTS